MSRKLYKNSSRDEIANVNFYAVRPEAKMRYIEVSDLSTETLRDIYYCFVHRDGHRIVDTLCAIITLFTSINFSTFTKFLSCGHFRNQTKLPYN